MSVPLLRSRACDTRIGVRMCVSAAAALLRANFVYEALKGRVEFASVVASREILFLIPAHLGFCR